jgi:hypothetical protein
MLRFANTAQETPIQEIWAYDVGAAPSLRAASSSATRCRPMPRRPLPPCVAQRLYRRPLCPDERTTVVALPAGASAGRAAAGAGNAAATTAADRGEGAAPIVHVLIPSGFGEAFAGKPLGAGVELWLGECP